MLPAAKFLASGGLRRLQEDRVLKFFLLVELIHESGGQIGQMAAAASALKTVAGRSGSEIATSGSCFFWFYVEGLYDSLMKGEAISKERFHLFLTQLFDSYFPMLEDSDCLKVDEAAKSIVLPTLGLRLQTAGGGNLLKLGSGRVGLQSEVEDLEDLVVEVDNPREHRLGGMKLSSNGQLLFGIDSLLDDVLARKSIAQLSTDACRELAELLGRAFELIRAVDEEVADQIATLIRWYFPIKTHDKRNVHNSFSVASLNGAIFLSESYSFLALAEALVHEYYHNELWMAMAVQKQLKSAPEEVLYSPWREDARPVLGLYHGTYVFTGLLDFFGKAERNPALLEHHSHFRARRDSIFHQVNTALAQFPAGSLEELGEQFVNSLAGTAGRHTEEVRKTCPSLPEAQVKHWHRWSVAYPDLVSSVTPPAAIQNLETVAQGENR